MMTRKIARISFIIYLLALIWIIVFKMDLSILYGRHGYASLNLIPFAGTAVYNGVLDYPEIIFNIASFIPFGFYMEIIFRKAEWERNLAVILLTSLVFEVVQYLLLLGVADITDLLANSLGGAIGINLMYQATAVWREKAYWRMTIFAGLATIFFILLTYFYIY